MHRSILLFAVSAILSLATFTFKSDHLFDIHLVVPAGLYFIIFLLLAFKPAVEWREKVQFSILALLLWIVLFLVSYNVLFMILVPVSGGVGAWLILILCRKFLSLDFNKTVPVVLAGVLSAVAGLLFMIATKDLPKDTFTLGVKAGTIIALWQLSVGWQLKVNENENEN